MLRKQTKKILVVMLFALTLVLAGRVDANAQTAAPAGVKQVKAGSSSVTVQWNAVMQNDICYYYRVSDDAGFKSHGLHLPDTAFLLHEPSAQLHEDHCKFHNRWDCLPAQPLHWDAP